MTGRRADRPERLDRPPLHLPRPRGGVVGALRWLVASVLLGIAALLLSGARTPGHADTVAVLAAGHDLAPGVPLTDADVHVVGLPRAAVPHGALRSGTVIAGRSPTGPVRAGEPLTDVRLMGPALVSSAAGAGAMAVPVRISDPGAVRLVHPGDHLDLIATATQGGQAGEAQVVAPNVTVLSVPPPADNGLVDGGLVVVATSPTLATRLAEAAVRSSLSFAVRSR